MPSIEGLRNYGSFDEAAAALESGIFDDSSVEVEDVTDDEAEDGEEENSEGALTR